VLLFIHVTMVVSAWELPTRTSVDVQQAMEALTVSRVSFTGLISRYVIRKSPVCNFFSFSYNMFEPS
jgi:hypothetical protein